MNTEKLKRLAEAATPGPWQQQGIKTNDRHWMRAVRTDSVASVAWCGHDEPQAHADAAYIACANPAAILSLIAERDQLLACLKDVIGWVPGKSAWHTNEPLIAVERARAAITKAEAP